MNSLKKYPVTKCSIEKNIGFITIDYPPVNALSQPVRQGIVEGLKIFEEDDAIKAIIIYCAGKTFIAGADIKEFSRSPLEPHLPEVVNAIEASNKPVIASLFGTVLGGGFEVALACHYRVALSSAIVGLPEVNLGLIPGAGGTQRLPRLVGSRCALEMISGGKQQSVKRFSNDQLFDAIFEKNCDLKRETISFVKHLIQSSQLKIKRVGKKIIEDDIENWQQAISIISKRSRGQQAPLVAANILKQSLELTIFEGMAIERKAFIQLRNSEQSAALRFAFAAERKASKTDFTLDALTVKRVGIIGGGTMGSGIATAFLSSNFEVVLIEQDQSALTLAQHRIENNFSANLSQRRMTEDQISRYLRQLSTSTNYKSLANCDLVIEAVFENIEIKKKIFSQLSRICRVDCVLATNTSYLDINEIADSTNRPEQVIGMHFFSPANIMKLVEVVRTNQSSQQFLMTALSVIKKLKKVPVLVGVCFGFAGNRMYTRYGREVQQMLLEGAKVAQIDKALTDWGMAMGPLAVADMSGIDIGYHARKTQPFPEFDRGYFKPSEIMFEQGRYGKKTSAGYYQYDEQGKAVVDESVDQLIHKKAKQLNIKQRTFSDEQIVQRALCALISEGLQLLKDGIVQRSSDIDVIWLHGYGFPRHKGGPMFQAEQIGKEKLSIEFARFRQKEGEKIWPIVAIESLS